MKTRKPLPAAARIVPILFLVLLFSPVGSTAPAAIASPAVAPIGQATDTAAVVASANQFGFDLYRSLAKTPGNLILSPASVYLGLPRSWPAPAAKPSTSFARPSTSASPTIPSISLLADSTKGSSCAAAATTT